MDTSFLSILKSTLYLLLSSAFFILEIALKYLYFSLFTSPVQATIISSIYYYVGLPTNLPNPPSFFNPQAHIVIKTIVFLSANLIISLSNLKHFMIFHYPKINL